MIIVIEPVGSDLRNVVLRLGGFHTERSSVAPIMYRCIDYRHNFAFIGFHRSDTTDIHVALTAHAHAIYYVVLTSLAGQPLRWRRKGLVNCFISACADGMRKFVLVRNNHVTVMATYLVYYPRAFAWLLIKWKIFVLPAGKLLSLGTEE